MNQFTKKGFTLVELMVAIAILATLSVVGTVIYTQTLNSTRQTKVKSDFNSLYKTIDRERTLKQVILKDLTNEYCSECYCRGVDVRADATCIQKMTQTWGSVGLSDPPKDPWGNVYTIDENDEEWPPTCVGDFIRSVGPDNHIDGFPGGTNDDQTFWLPTFRCE